MKPSKITVFDIKRFAVHDGQGIRTTIFLKGCPLRCKWCQNPEGLSSLKQVLYLENKCIHCFSCVEKSRNEAILVEDGNIKVNRTITSNWDEIVDACPTMALQFDSSEYSVEDLIQEAKKDIPFFKYGGGVTISGGEPFNQFEMLLKLCQKLKENDIHVAIETSLYTELEKVKQILPFLDQIYIDCKIYDLKKHQEATGVSNQIILENIQYLLQSDKKDQVIVRTPLIPGFTESTENIQDISQFLVSCYKDVQYEILNYNPLAKAKYTYLDMKYCFEENPKLYPKHVMETYYELARQVGIKNLILE